MKKFSLYFIIGLAATAFIACDREKDALTPDPKDQEEEVVVDNKVPMVFSAVIEETKSNIDGSFVLWDDTDKVAIFDGSSLNEFTASSVSADGKSASFSGSAESAAEYHAIAPFEKAGNINTESSRISVTISTSQTVTAGHCVDPLALLSTAVTTSTNELHFTNQFSLVKVTLTRSDVASVKFIGNNNESICGTNHYYYGGANPGTVDLSNAGQKSVTISYKNAGGNAAAFPAGDYYMSIWPTEFTQGYKIILTLTDGSKTLLSTSESASYVRNGGRQLGEIDNKSTYCPPVIMTAAQLKMWRRLAEAGAYAANEEVKLGADIDLNGYVWKPASSFLGIFDGQDHKIYNFVVSDASESRTGFIRTLGSSGGEAAVLKNVVFGSSNGTSADGTSSITMTKESDSSWMYAGLVGYAHLNSTVQNVTNFVPVSASSSVTGKHAIGGIVGMTNKNVTIEGCINRAPITDNSACETTDDSSIGGVVGWNDSEGLTVSGCENFGAVTNNCVGVSCIGGIMGKATCQSFKMEECSNHANITNAASSVTSGTNNWDKAVSVGGVLGRFGKNNNTYNYIDKCSIRINK